MNTSRGKIGACEEYILGFPYADDKAVQDEVGCSVGTVSTARRRLRDKGLAKRRPNDHTSPLETEGAKELLDRVDKARGETGEPLTTEEKLEKLARFARKGDMDNDYKRSIDAMVAHTKLEESTRAKSRLGPAEPLTDEDKIKHTAIIFDIAGPDLAARAAIEAYKEGTELEDFCIAIGRHKVTASRPQAGTSASEQTAISTDVEESNAPE